MKLCKHDWVGDDDCAYCQVEALQDELEESKQVGYAYAALIMQVVNKIPGESRHETAKRIIRQHESHQSSPAQEAK